jgi:hypothetical protein
MDRLPTITLPVATTGIATGNSAKKPGASLRVFSYEVGQGGGWISIGRDCHGARQLQQQPRLGMSLPGFRCLAGCCNRVGAWPARYQEQEASL